MNKEMTVRVWRREQDYPTAVGWWQGHGCDEGYIPLPEYLPRSGFVVERAGRALCMGWLFYYHDVPAAQMGYIVGNPENKAEESSVAIAVLIEEVNRLADRQRLRLVGRYDHPGLLRMMKSLGWTELISGLTEMIRYPDTDGLQKHAGQPTKEVSEGGL